MPEYPVVVWFRTAFRLSDNQAWNAALDSGSPVIPCFIWTQEEVDRLATGPASRWWLHRSLLALDGELRRHGLRLAVFRGHSTADVLEKVVRVNKAAAVHAGRAYDPLGRAQESHISSLLARARVRLCLYRDLTLVDPWEIFSQAGKPYSVFTPFWRKLQPDLSFVVPEGGPRRRARAPEPWPASLTVLDLDLADDVRQGDRLGALWNCGERAAGEALARFIETGLCRYHEMRDRPDCEGTSRLSPHLHFGEISAARVVSAIEQAVQEEGKSSLGQELSRSKEVFLSELGWRDFAYYLLWHFPQIATQPLRPEFASFPWENDEEALSAWQEGRTGYPLVDAGMRQLAQTGWMHNRVRMVVASFLAKDLLIRWQVGASWFLQTLVDADLASNSLGWQWSTGCGVDAVPYYRVFNPVVQGRQHDPTGAYVRKWVPELAKLDNRWIHRPWQAPREELLRAGVQLGVTYPTPIVDHVAARARALLLFRAYVKKS